MRKIIASVIITLDSVVEAPHLWSLPVSDDSVETFALEQLSACDALLLGRETYEGFAQAWPNITDDRGFADRMNRYPKYVVSSTLTDPGWNAEVVTGDLTTEITKLKDQPGKDILIFGSGTLVTSLIEHGLLDELRLMVNPVVAGTGRRLFPGEGPLTRWALDGTRTFDSGVVLLAYRPEPKAPAS